MDHRTGYRAEHTVAGEGPYFGSALLWAVALEAARREPGLLTAPALCDIDGEGVAELFRVEEETVADPERRAGLFRDLARGLERDHGGELGAIYHSHTRTAPYPSQTDINFAANWPGVEWIILGLAGTERLQARSYVITDGRVHEVPIAEPPA